MKLKKINFWPALPVAVLVAAAVTSRLIAGPDDSAPAEVVQEPTPIVAPAPDLPGCSSVCCEIPR